MVYTGKQLKEIVFPLGGIGTGSIGLAGNGCLVDWEIFNRPNKGSINGYSCFAVKAEYPDGRSSTRVLQGDWTKDLIGKYSKAKFHGYGYGPHSATMCGYPHFKKVKFDGTFPIATLTFEDDHFPGKVIMKAFNPFIPLETDDSSIPAAFFEIKIISKADDIRYTVILSVANPFEESVNQKISNGPYTAVQLMYYGKKPSDKEYGDITVAVDCKDGLYQEYWYRGGWQDGVTTFWRDLSDGSFENRRYAEPGKGDVCSVGASKALRSKESTAFRFVISWNVPNNFNYWDPYKDTDGNDVTWKNYYATLFADSAASCLYSLDNWESLYEKTSRFCEALHASTLDGAVLDAVSSTISVLKSPTVLRLEDGSFYGWEGVHEQEGSCEGTCTHVWSYAYALCFLFPDLERGLRDTEFRYDTDEDGRMYFRTALPLGRGYVVQPPCVDGQMATVIKSYREWKISGDNDWLREHWGDIKRILEFAWNEKNTFEWDRDHDGVLEGRQHHTLDMELFGPSAWLQGMYLAALKAAAEMARFLGDDQKSEEYTALFEQGYRWTRDNLFNGKYFYHKVDLKDKGYTAHFGCPQYWNEEKEQLKYQIGEGCEIDQMLGQWHANICGLGDIFDKGQRRTALNSMMQNNFKTALRDFANMWRIFALNDEGGTIMCDYPEGSYKPIIPVPYCEECMTGFEYAFAGLLISEGFVEDGLKVVCAVRDRYDGEKRNPWNEIECGSNYARPMASFALLPLLSGFEFDLPEGHIGFSPIIHGNFRCFWSLGTGWGDFIKTEASDQIVLASGYLELKSMTLGGIGTVRSVFADGREIPFEQRGDRLSFAKIRVEKEIRVEVSL